MIEWLYGYLQYCAISDHLFFFHFIGSIAAKCMISRWTRDIWHTVLDICSIMSFNPEQAFFFMFDCRATFYSAPN